MSSSRFLTGSCEKNCLYSKIKLRSRSCLNGDQARANTKHDTYPNKDKYSKYPKSWLPLLDSRIYSLTKSRCAWNANKLLEWIWMKRSQKSSKKEKPILNMERVKIFNILKLEMKIKVNINTRTRGLQSMGNLQKTGLRVSDFEFENGFGGGQWRIHEIWTKLEGSGFPRWGNEPTT